VYLSRNLDQHMPKNGLISKKEKKTKNCKNRRSVGDSVPKPRWRPAAGATTPDPELLFLYIIATSIS